MPVGVDAAWALMTDVERIVPCMPGAELTERLDERTFSGKVNVKLGPISLGFAGQAHFEELDEAAHQMRLKASGKETKGRGTASATVVGRMTPNAAGTRVDITTDLHLQGAVAQYGRSMIADVSGRLMEQFAECLRTQLVGTGEEAEAALAKAQKGVPGIRLGMAAMWAAVRRFFRRLFGRERSPSPGA